MRRLLIFLVLLAMPLQGQMVIRRAAAGGGAIAFDVGTVDNCGPATCGSCSISHEAGASPTLALMWVALDADRGADLDGTVTYGGESMTLVGTSGSATESGDQKIWLFEKHSPLGGTRTAFADYSTDDHGTCIIMTFTGTHATDATVELSGYDNSGATCADAQTTITLNGTSSWMVTADVWHDDDTLPITETNFTARDEGVNKDGWSYGDSTGHSGSRTHTSDAAVTDECAQLSVELIPPS